MRATQAGWLKIRFVFGVSSIGGDAKSVVASHLEELVGLAAKIIRAGIEEGTFRNVDPVVAGRAVLFATSRFSHPAHAGEWNDPAMDGVYDDVWQMLMNGLCVVKGEG